MRKDSFIGNIDWLRFSLLLFICCTVVNSDIKVGAIVMGFTDIGITCGLPSNEIRSVYAPINKIEEIGLPDNFSCAHYVAGPGYDSAHIKLLSIQVPQFW